MSDSEPLIADGDTVPIQNTAAIFGWILVVSALVVLSPFAWAALQSELVSILQRITPEQIRDFTLVAYFASWVVAMWVDLHIHKSAYQGDICKHGLVPEGVGVAALLVVAAIIMIWSRQSEVKLAIAMDVFFVANFVAWLQARRLTEQLIASTRAALQEDADGAPTFDQLNIIASYISGRWHIYRFCAMLSIICVVNVVALSVSARETIARFFQWINPTLPRDRLSAFLPDLSVILFVLIAETWSWSQRMASIARARRLRTRLLSDHPRLAEYMTQFFDQQFKAVNYLMIAHAAALLTTMTVAKDYLSTQKSSAGAVDFALSASRPIGSFVGYFSWGLALAVLAYVTLSIARDTVMSAIFLNSRHAPNQTSSYVAWALCAGSALLLLTGIFTIAGQIGGVRIPI